MSRRRNPAGSPAAPWPAESGSGLSTGVLLIAAAVASPALYRSLVQDLLPLHVALQRYLIVAVGCWVLAGLIRSVLPTARQPSRAGADRDAGSGAEPPLEGTISESRPVGSDDGLRTAS